MTEMEIEGMVHRESKLTPLPTFTVFDTRAFAVGDKVHADSALGRVESCMEVGRKKAGNWRKGEVVAVTPNMVVVKYVGKDGRSTWRESFSGSDLDRVIKL